MDDDPELRNLREMADRYRKMAEGEMNEAVAARINRLADALERLIRLRQRRTRRDPDRQG